MKKKINKDMVGRIKDRVNKSAQGSRMFMRIPTGSKAKIRFISDLDEAVEITEHDKWGELYPTICVDKHFGMECSYCGKEGIRKREVYCWTVWDYENKEKKIMKFAANNFTPTPQLISFFETYGTLLDRDYVVSKAGQGQSISYGVVPLDKAEFPKNLRAFTETEVLEKCVEDADDIEIDEIEELKNRTKADEEEEEEETVAEKDEFEYDDDEPFDDEE